MSQARDNMGRMLKRLYSPWTLALCLVGLLLNLGLSKLVIAFGLPLYLDNVGSILVAALGGALPGMAVGFFSNVLGSISEPISMYYTMLTVLIAWHASRFSRRGWLRKWQGWVLASASFVVIGGGAGSLMTWFLYGGGIGGIAEPYALILHAGGFSPFWAQVTADMLIDIPDKLITVGLDCLLLRLYPKVLYDKFPLSHLYDRSREESDKLTTLEQTHYRHRSVSSHILGVLIVAIALVSVTSVTIGTVYHHQRLMNSYQSMALGISRQAADCVDADMVETYLAQGVVDESYEDTMKQLEMIYRSTPELAYLYIYTMRPDGCFVVFDVDTDQEEGDPLGTDVSDEQGIPELMDEFLTGRPVEPDISDGEYGRLITAYTPVQDSGGRTVAYAGADISMETYALDLMTYIIQVMSVLFAISLVVGSFALWYSNRRISAPINALMDQSQAFDSTPPEEWLNSSAWRNRARIQTGDEIEELYHTMCRVEENVSRNVTRLIETERQLRQSEELERVNRELERAIQTADEASAAKEEFYSRMSHDMRTPMNGIIGLVELSREENDPAVLRKNIEKIGIAGSYLLGLINDTLDMSKIGNDRLTLSTAPVSVRRLAEDLRDMLRPSVEQKGLHFTLRNQGVSLNQWILTDEMRLKQVFMNLMSNAVKFTPAGGSIALDVIGLNGPEGRLSCQFSLRDTGVGMSEEFLTHHIFQPFSQERNEVTREYAGTGLGLAIVKKLVDLMGGRIQVESQLGKGSTFTLWLDFPIVEGEETPAAAAQAPDFAQLRGRRALLCEDHPLNTEISTRLLEKVGMVVEHAENGQVAVERFAQSPPGWFDAVLMDVRMPIMDGLEATRRIRGLDRTDAQTVPIIATTANAFSSDVEKTRAAGMNAHLAKPIDPHQLWQTLLTQIQRASGWDA